MIYSRFMLDKFAYISNSFYGFMVGLELIGFSLPDFFLHLITGAPHCSLQNHRRWGEARELGSFPAGQIYWVYIWMCLKMLAKPHFTQWFC